MKPNIDLTAAALGLIILDLRLFYNDDTHRFEIGKRDQKPVITLRPNIEADGYDLYKGNKIVEEGLGLRLALVKSLDLANQIQ